MAKFSQNETAGLSFRCVAALIGCALAFVTATSMVLLGASTTESQTPKVSELPDLPVHQIAELGGATGPTIDDMFRVSGIPAYPNEALQFNGYHGFAIERESGGGPLGVVVTTDITEIATLQDTLAGHSEAGSRDVAVRLRPDLARRASIQARRFAPGRPVFVLEPIRPTLDTDPTGRVDMRVVLFAGLGCFLGGLFFVFRALEVKSSVARSKHQGEDQPWRIYRSPSSWAQIETKPDKK